MSRLTCSGGERPDSTQFADGVFDMPRHNRFSAQLSERPVRLCQNARSGGMRAARASTLLTREHGGANTKPASKFVCSIEVTEASRKTNAERVYLPREISLEVQHGSACTPAMKRHDLSAGFAALRQNMFEDDELSFASGCGTPAPSRPISPT